MTNLDQIYTDSPVIYARNYFKHLSEIMGKIDAEAVSRFVGMLLEARKRGSMIFFIGNGGSAATASHFANDLMIGTRSPGTPFRVLSLSDNAAILTALANDFGFEEIFVRQLKALGRPGDVLVGISASGNSTNLIRAFEYAASVGIKTFSLTAFDGGNLLKLADDGIHVPTPIGDYGPAEDIHLILDHLVVSFLSRKINQTFVAA